MYVPVKIVNAFVDGGKGGNPAGIVLDADELSQEQKQQIAKAVAHSETAFVSRSRSADFKLDFFTPVRQIAHCGHATVAAFCYLREIGRLAKTHTSKETIDGNRGIVMKGDAAFMEQTAPRYMDVKHDIDAIVESLGLARRDLAAGCDPAVVDTGNRFLIVPLKNEAVVLNASPDQKEIAVLSDAHDLIGCYIFSTQVRVSGRDAGARMFAPRYGIAEESATGMAAGPLGCFLHDKMGHPGNAFRIEQGHLMNPSSPSLIRVELSIAQGAIAQVMAGGTAKVMGERSVKI